MPKPLPAQSNNGVREDGGYVGKCTGCYQHYWNYWGRGTYCPACLAGYVDNLHEQLGVSDQEIERAAARIGDLEQELRIARFDADVPLRELREQLDRAVETRENANAVSIRVEVENRRLREALRWIATPGPTAYDMIEHARESLDV